MKKLDKSYLSAEFKSIISKEGSLSILKESELAQLAKFTEQYVDKLLEAKDKKLEEVTKTSVEMQEKLIKSDTKFNDILNKLNDSDKNYQLAVDANNKLHDELVKRNAQVEKLINSCVNLIEKLG